MSDFGSKSGKERVREYKAMESILRGETPEKRIMVGYEGKKQKQGDIESPLTEIMQIGVMKVVNITNKIEIPSMPTL